MFKPGITSIFVRKFNDGIVIGNREEIIKKCWEDLTKNVKLEQEKLLQEIKDGFSNAKTENEMIQVAVEALKALYLNFTSIQDKELCLKSFSELIVKMRRIIANDPRKVLEAAEEAYKVCYDAIQDNLKFHRVAAIRIDYNVYDRNEREFRVENSDIGYDKTFEKLALHVLGYDERGLRHALQIDFSGIANRFVDLAIAGINGVKNQASEQGCTIF